MNLLYSFIIITVAATAAIFGSNEHQTQQTENAYTNGTPALVVGIMIDQLRPEYISRYWDHLGDNGFKRIVNEGFTFTDAHFNYMPTSTGPGHATVWTGSTPSVNGVMGNSWFVKEEGRRINVIEVPGYNAVGGSEESSGDKGPSNMLTTTVGDELRLHTNNRSRVLGISRKDRGAILPAGHTGDAYWFDGNTGNYITSTFYRDELPSWLVEFNDRNLVQEYLSEPWETSLPIEEYIESIDDENPYERLFRGEEASVFPHDLPALAEEHGYGPGLLSSTPFSDKHLKELAIAAIEGEDLGQRDVTDILAISFSAMDAVGHQFGPASKEVQDAFIRLDTYLGELLDYLEVNFGKENILLFITSDHGALHVPEYLADQNIPAGRVVFSEYETDLREYVESTYGEDFILYAEAYELFFDRDYIRSQNLDLGDVQRDIARFVLEFDKVAGALPAEVLAYSEFSHGIQHLVQNGYNMKRSGDVKIWLESNWYPSGASTGTGHGSPWGNDTHAPMHWFGWNIPSGSSAHRAYVTDFAPTVATFLNSSFPSGMTGKPLNDFMKSE